MLKRISKLKVKDEPSFKDPQTEVEENTDMEDDDDDLLLVKRNENKMDTSSDEQDSSEE